jgi:hypothetical protein
MTWLQSDGQMSCACETDFWCILSAFEVHLLYSFCSIVNPLHHLRNLHDYDAMSQLKATTQICVRLLNNLTEFFFRRGSRDEATAKSKDKISFA